MDNELNLPALMDFNNLPELFKENGLENHLVQIETFVRSINLDPSTEKGRSDMKSLARRVASCKSAIDDARMRLNEDHRRAIDVVNAEGKRGINRLQALQDEVIRPVKEFKEREDKRIAEHENRINAMQMLTLPLMPTEMDVTEAICSLNNNFVGHDFEEFKAKAEALYNAKSAELTACLASIQKAKAEAEELERLRKIQAEADAKAEVERKEHERIAIEEKLRIEAEAKAAKDAQEKIEKEKKAAQAKIDEANRLAKEAEQREAQAKIDAEVREKKAEKDKQDALAKAEKDKQDAIIAEQKRVAKAEEERKAEDKKREENKVHVKKLSTEAIDSLLLIPNMTEELAKAVVVAIHNKKIANVTIQY